MSRPGSDAIRDATQTDTQAAKGPVAVTNNVSRPRDSISAREAGIYSVDASWNRRRRPFPTP